ncbi:hypothetical protein [Haloarcula halophila]|uniref:hypothetical protein n=1 Tax=Haloarcula TaxID=2237 RepID=UPI0023E3D012|nr:hypothetical protein [Halomicroarcula sp. DFY41]
MSDILKMAKKMNIRLGIIVFVVVIASFSGCTGLSDSTQKTTTSEPQSPTPIHDATNTESTTPTPTNTGGSTDTPKTTSVQQTEEADTTTEYNKTIESRRQHYRIFAEDYVRGVAGGNSTTTFGLAEIDARNRSVRFFHRAPTNNTSQYLLEQYVILYGYQRIIETYPRNEEPFTDEDKSWIPRTVNVTVRTQDGRLYERAYIKYDWGLARANGNISERKYHFLYIGEAEPGPAHPEEGI